MSTATTLPSIKRPNGMTYRPRKITANAVGDEDGLLCGVIVLGTHDVARAQPLADRFVHWQFDAGYAAASPERGWYRDGFGVCGRCWVTDEKRGRAGVFFTEIAEAAS